MNILTQELFTLVPFPAMYVVTTNAFVKHSGELVMGRGAALQAKTMYPTLPMQCGHLIQSFGHYPVSYGFLQVLSPFRDGKAGFGIFQVKNMFSDAADLNIIVKACIALKKWMTANPTVFVRMNYPGIGNGRLKRDGVEKVLQSFLSECDKLTVCLKP